MSGLWGSPSEGSSSRGWSRIYDIRRSISMAPALDLKLPSRRLMVEWDLLVLAKLMAVS